MSADLSSCDPAATLSLTAPSLPARNGRVANSAREGSPTMSMWDFMAISKALADENRVRMLLGLRRQELCLCQIIEMMGLAASTVSKHMSILRQARLVESRKEGRWQYYRLAGLKASPAVRQAIDWVGRSLANDAQVAADAKRLEQILKMDAEEICRKQNRC